MKTIFQALITKANRHLVKATTCRANILKQENRIQKLNEQIEALEELRLAAQWNKTKLESQAYASETIYERSLDAARLEYTKNMDGDSSQKNGAWGEFLAQNNMM